MAIPCFSQAESAFQEGEYLKFRVRYGIFNASYASLTLKNKTYQGKTVYHALGKGETTGLAKLFFKVDDTYESYFDKETGKPYFSTGLMGSPPGGVDLSGVQGPDPVTAGSTPVPVGPSGAPYLLP